MEPGTERDQAVDHQSLVCRECWSNIFNTDAICAFWQREPGAFEYIADFLHVLEASKDGCQWCQAFLSITRVSSLEDWRLKNWGREGPDGERTMKFSVRMQWERITPQDSEPTDECRLLVGNSRQVFEIAWYTYEATNSVGIIDNKCPRPDLSSGEVFKQAKQWIATCKGHRNCLQQDEGSLPRRIIEVSPPDSSVPCRIRESSDLLGQYAALSYCWGKQPYVLTSENKEDLMIELDEDRLPQTIMDAIHITRKLGYKFLWVDALCIVQDSTLEKAEDIANMNKTYQRAAFTIVAGSANSASEGFLHSTRPISHMLTNIQRNTSKEFKIPCKYTTDDYITVGLKTLEPSSSFMDPIARRAWALQETLLSPRLLSYSCHTLTWHCKDAFSKLDNWYYPDRDSYESLAQNITLSYGRQEISRKWDTIVKLYTERNLTVSEDKLLALAAIAAVFSSVLGPTYLAGIWESALPEALLWIPQSGYPEAELRSFASAHPYLNRFARRPKTYRAPTWSWASIDGFVTYGTNELEDSNICKVVDCETVPKYPIVRFGEVISGYIKIRGCMRQLNLRPRKKLRDGLLDWLDWELATDSRNGPESRFSNSSLIHIDTEEDVYERTVQCMPIAKMNDRVVPQDTRGLVLVVEDGNVYKRIGTFDGFEKDFEGVEEETIVVT